MDEVLKGAAPAGGLDPTAVPIVITLVHGTWAAKLATTGTFYLAAAREKTGIDTGALVMYTNIQAQEKGDSLGRRLIVLSPLLGGCRESNKKSAVTSQDNIKSVYTSLEAGSCNQETDQNDPNAASYLLCPGVAGYELIVRQVDSGRTSIDVVDASRRAFPLNYQEFITRRMFNLGSNAEWRVATRGGKPVPIALIVRVRAHESNAEPEKVTNTYFAVAKIAPDRACVTARIPEGSQPDAEVRSAADSAVENPCVAAQPPLTADGVVIR